ncbi:MAG: glucosamine-6-phosphate deaminase [Clostridia bacterium]|nr:glucosamine-6-phosphate deaminase [Clostridia bacterium]
MNFTRDNLQVSVFTHRKLMGRAAANDISKCFAALLKEREEINVIFAAAPSQNDVLEALVADKGVEWGRINAYHMDEYIGLKPSAPQGFGNFLRRHIFSRVPFKSVNCIDASAKNPEEEAERYAKLLTDNPVDVVILGIGENGHIAFNDPPVADFNDGKKVKAVELDDVCRRQQVNDGCFAHFNDVPKYALTLTGPALTAAKYMFCIVPAETKANAVYQTLNGSIGEHCPATILRTHPAARLYLDEKSAKLII